MSDRPKPLSREEFRLGQEQIDDLDPPELHRCVATIALLERALRAEHRARVATDVLYLGDEMCRGDVDNYVTHRRIADEALAPLQDLGWLDPETDEEE